MIAIGYLALYLLSGYLIAVFLRLGKNRVHETYIGLSLGMLLFMWLPALFAFPFGFTMKAELYAIFTLLALIILSYLPYTKTRKPKTKTKVWYTDDRKLVARILMCVIPLALLTAYLHYTHNIMPAADGSLHVGQSTYGDLPLHLSIATSLRDAPFPPDYSLLPGTLLSYPFLMDTLSTSLLLLGMDLSWAMVVPSIIMSTLVYAGIFLLAYEISRSLTQSAITLFLLAFCGGFGFLYSWDKLPQDISRFLDIFTGFYKAPANLTSDNIRWSNLIADMWIPQRTFLAGWCMVIPALLAALNLGESLTVNEGRPFRGSTLTLVIFGGGLPLIHTHSFLALGLFCVGFFIYKFFQTERECRMRFITIIVLTLAAILALALPQLLAFTFKQSSAEGFLRPHFNWVNQSNGTFYDTYLYFWLKNIGAPMLLIIPALLNLNRNHRPIAVGAFSIFIVAELILFQPNAYDNNKLFYVWYLLIIPIAVQFGAKIWRRLKGVRGRGLLAAAFLAISMFSGVLSVVREVVSDYQLFTEDAVVTAKFAEQNLPSDAVFMTATNHNNALASLAGKKIVCGTSSYLFYHGLSYQTQEADVRKFYADPRDTQILSRYNVAYIVYGPYERNISADASGILDEAYPLVYEYGGYRIYKVE